MQFGLNPGDSKSYHRSILNRSESLSGLYVNKGPSAKDWRNGLEEKTGRREIISETVAFLQSWPEKEEGNDSEEISSVLFGPLIAHRPIQLSECFLLIFKAMDSLFQKVNAKLFFLYHESFPQTEERAQKAEHMPMLFT